jgi:hypothetical protein
MNKDRIQIDGVWYVKEFQPEINIINFIGCVYENDEYCWEATKIYEDDAKTLYPGVDIKFTDKRVKPWKVEYWDNNIWIKAIHDGEPQTLAEAKEDMSNEGVNEFRQFVKILIEKGWI